MTITLPTELVVVIKLLAGGYVGFWLYILAAISLHRLRRRFTPH